MKFTAFAAIVGAAVATEIQLTDLTEHDLQKIVDCYLYSYDYYVDGIENNYPGQEAGEYLEAGEYFEQCKAYYDSWYENESAPEPLLRGLDNCYVHTYAFFQLDNLSKDVQAAVDEFALDC